MHRIIAGISDDETVPVDADDGETGEDGGHGGVERKHDRGGSGAGGDAGERGHERDAGDPGVDRQTAAPGAGAIPGNDEARGDNRDEPDARRDQVPVALPADMGGLAARGARAEPRSRARADGAAA